MCEFGYFLIFFLQLALFYFISPVDWIAVHLFSCSNAVDLLCWYGCPCWTSTLQFSYWQPLIFCCLLQCMFLTVIVASIMWWEMKDSCSSNLMSEFVFLDIIFTSGGTEANNLVLNTAVEHFRMTQNADNFAEHSLPHIITSSLEHDSIKLVLERYRNTGKAGSYCSTDVILLWWSQCFFYKFYTKWRILKQVHNHPFKIFSA